MFLAQGLSKILMKNVLKRSHLKVVRPISNYENSKNRKSQLKKNYNESQTKKIDKNVNTYKKTSSFEYFEDELCYRRQQARNSLIFKIDNEASFYKLVNDLENIGTQMSNIFVFGNLDKSMAKTVLIEFESNQNIENVLNIYTNHFTKTSHLPNKLRMLLYKTKETTSEPFKDYKNIKFCYSNEADEIEHFEGNFDDKFAFLKSLNFNQQINKFYTTYKLNEIDIRFRYFIASIVEESFYSLFENSICLPFGSSVNNIGHRKSDLDLLFSLENHFYNTNNFKNDKIIQQLKGRFYFYSKHTNESDERTNAQKFLELSNFILKNILPRFNVKNIIKGARVPILEFDFQIPNGTRFNCDLSMSNLQASYQMTKLFWIYTQLDNRISPLIFLIKYWARLTKITNTARPSPNITNFQLTVLIFNFLLRIENPLILPIENLVTSNNLAKDPESDPRQILVDNLNISSIRKMTVKNNLNLIDLLKGFFNYYSNFDFKENIVSLSRELNMKKDRFKYEQLVILNPFFSELNASKNVNKANVEKFSYLCNQSYNYFQSKKNESDIIEFFKEISEKSKSIKNVSYETNNIADEMNI